MTINQLVTNEGSFIFYEPTFCNMLESYMGYLRESASSTKITIIPHDVYKYEGDLFGLLSINNIDPSLHWIVMRMNKITNPLDVDSELSELLIPDISVINNLSQIYINGDKKTMT